MDMESILKIEKLSEKNIEAFIKLTKHLNPTLSEKELKNRSIEMFSCENYTCFGLYDDNQSLLGLCGFWTTVRLYSGKQLELDNLIINPDIQSKGLGREFLSLIELWAKNNDYETIELNTYVQNSRSHKFYFNLGYEILGYHFQKKL